MSDVVNWLGLTEAQLETGLIERGHVTFNVLTGERNKRVVPGSVKKIEDLSIVLRPAFTKWWRTGEIIDVAEPGGVRLKALIDGDTTTSERSVVGAFLDLDWVLREPSVRGMVVNGPYDSLIHSPAS